MVRIPTRISSVDRRRELGSPDKFLGLGAEMILKQQLNVVLGVTLVACGMIVAKASAAVLQTGNRLMTVVADSNSQCLSCPPSRETKTDEQTVAGTAQASTSIQSRGAFASQSSQILTDGTHHFGITADLASRGPQAATEFGFNNATSRLQFDFTIDRSVIYGISGVTDFDSLAPPFVRSDRSQVELTGPNVSIAVENNDDAFISRFGVLGAGTYQLEARTFASGSTIEAGAVDLDFSLAVFAIDKQGDLDGDGVFTGNDIDLFRIVLEQGHVDTAFDFNRDGQVDADDRSSWVREIAKTYLGDANLDGEFNTGDLVDVFQTGEYEDGIDRNSVWARGDWNGDLEFDTSDLVAAFQDGGYEQGPLERVNTVAEPTSITLLIVCLTVCTFHVARSSNRIRVLCI